MAKFNTKHKQSKPANSANKQTKKNDTFCLFFYMTSSRPIRLIFICSVLLKDVNFSPQVILLRQEVFHQK